MRHPGDPKPRPEHFDRTLPDLKAPEVDPQLMDGFDFDDATIRETGALGSVANGRYLLMREIGRGGMGVVYEARDTQLDRPVALKVLSGDPLNAEALGRFVIEARVAASIPHENICSLYDVGVDAATISPYMAMELLSGQDLEAMLLTRGPLPIDEACGYLVQACSGLTAAHRMGVVHRDVKLSNLFVIEEGGRRIVKVLDFGVSKAPHFGDVTRLTSTGATIGSPVYMAPEQVRNARNVDVRADVWSMGIVLYELLTGTPPFVGASVFDLFDKILNADPAPIGRPDAPPALKQIITFTLAKDRERRYGDIELLQRALIPFAHRRPSAR